MKKQKINSLENKIMRFEESKNAVKNSDFSDLKTFLKNYLNIPEKKQREKLAEEFKKRHIELYEFLKNNSDLISAETGISKIKNDVSGGISGNSSDEKITYFFEIIGENFE